MTTTTIRKRELLGYGCGEVGVTLIFALVNAIVQKYYTDVLGLAANSIMILFIVARLWDAINDPLWGRFVDTRAPSSNGKYKIWLRRMAIPLAISVVLLFVKIPGLTSTQYLVYAYITYILFGMLNTSINIPYGSLASVMTNNSTVQSSLSVIRSVFGVLASIPPIVIAAIVFTTKDGVTQFNGGTLIISLILCGIFCAAMFFICSFSVKERIEKKAVAVEKGRTVLIIKKLLADRAFFSLSVAGLLLIASTMFTQTYYLYLFNSYFNASGLYIFVTLSTYLPIVFIAPIMGKIVKLIGKAEICSAGMLVASVSQFVLMFLKTQNPYVFIFCSLISGIGTTFFIMQIWAMVNDMIDNFECKTGIREEASTYSLFLFARKLGQTVAGVLATSALVWINYTVGSATQSAQTITDMYTISTLVPACIYLISAVVLGVWYPITRKKLAALQIEKEALRGKVG